MSQYSQWYHPYQINPAYAKKVAYFSMEFAVDQALKTYSGGLGFLAGSHMRSAYGLGQNLIGISMLWKYGYYDQVRQDDKSMRAQFLKKYYTFLEDTGIMVEVLVNGHPVKVKALVLKPEVFGTAPLYFLTTDIHENDFLARTITHRLYDQDTAARIAQCTVLGIGGAMVVDALGGAEIYHLNEGHALPLAFHLYKSYGSLADVQKRLVFTTHTPEKAGNEEHDINLLSQMNFFGKVSLGEVRQMTQMYGPTFNFTLAGLRLAKVANGVSQLHGEVARLMWEENPDICEIKAITNAQNVAFWQDPEMAAALAADDDRALMDRKAALKRELFEVVADQTGKLFRPEILTIVWARRFAAYKRADLVLRDLFRFFDLVERDNMPVQFIWAGKPYPFDFGAIDMFNRLVQLTHKRQNCAVLTGYELGLSEKLKKGSDVWLNTPRRPREASGTSGMTAAMNGSVNCSVQDGWIPEFARHGENAFILPIADLGIPDEGQDHFDHHNLMQMLEQQIIPLYYGEPSRWTAMVKQGMRDVIPAFSADRMAEEYYRELYD